jgi:hypothetical protein
MSGHPQAYTIVTLNNIHICVVDVPWSLLVHIVEVRHYRGFESFVVCPYSSVEYLKDHLISLGCDGQEP